MSETKKELRWFSIMDYEKEARYLSRMHQKGWKFKRVTMPGIYTFEKCEPEKVIYQLDYNQEGMKNQMEYVKMFEDCGWDDASRLDMMNRIFRGRVIPLIVIFCCLIVNGYNAMAGHGGHVLASVFSILMILYIVIFLQFTLKYVSFRRKIK